MTRSPIADRAELARALALPTEDYDERLDNVLPADETLSRSDLDGGIDYTSLVELRDHRLTELRTWWSPPFPFPFVWPDGWYIPSRADWRTYGPQFSEPPAANRYALDWTTSHSPADSASRADGTASAYHASYPDEPYGKAESGIGIRYSPSFALGTVRVVPEIRCNGTVRTRLEATQLVAGAISVATSVVVAQWQVLPNGFDLLRWYQVPIRTTGWRDQSYFPLMDAFTASPAASGFKQQFLVEKGRAYLFGVVARIETRSTLTVNGRPVHGLAGNVFNLWGQHNAFIPRIKIKTVNRYML